MRFIVSSRFLLIVCFVSLLFTGCSSNDTGTVTPKEKVSPVPQADAVEIRKVKTPPKLDPKNDPPQ